MLRGLDRFEHRGEDAITVAQDLDAVPLGGCDPDDPFQHAADARFGIVVGIPGLGDDLRGAHDAGTQTVIARGSTCTLKRFAPLRAPPSSWYGAL